MKQCTRNIRWWKRNQQKKLRQNHRGKHGRKNNLGHSESIDVTGDLFFLNSSNKLALSKAIWYVDNAFNTRKSLSLTKAKKVDVAAVTYAVAWVGKHKLRASPMSVNAIYLKKVVWGKPSCQEIIPVTKISADQLDFNKNEKSARVVTDMLDAYSDVDNPSREKFSIALNEACNNVNDHAQAQTVYFSSYQDQDVKAFVVYDNGVGIPETIKSKIDKSKWQSFLSNLRIGDNHDALCLRAAIDRTSTGFSYRGKGLGDIIGSIKASTNADARLVILSGFAILHYVKDGTIKTMSIATQIRGTLLYWIV